MSSSPDFDRWLASDGVGPNLIRASLITCPTGQHAVRKAEFALIFGAGIDKGAEIMGKQILQGLGCEACES
ncbi:MAG TPA: hypothetical protein VK663_09715 [Burkholderiales bacterium]|nr:hypothetical protein [Burkholderiales bacterium]